VVEAKDRAEQVAPGEGKAFWVAGDLVTFKVVSEDTDGAYSLFEVVSNPGGGPPPHVHHHEDEIFCVLEGEHEVSIGERTIRADAGTVVYGPKNVAHAYKNVGATSGKILGFVAPAGLEGFFEEVGGEATDELSPPPFGQKETERLLAAAPKYGIEIPPPLAQ
jgi:mannose-6-phosphate isomerase-like protein (cupin superfamily)